MSAFLNTIMGYKADVGLDLILFMKFFSQWLLQCLKK